MRFGAIGGFLGSLPGAGGNPWIGLVYIATLVTGAGLVKFIVFSVRKNERGVWFRLGKVVYTLKGGPKILRPGNVGVRFPFAWRLFKISVNIRTNRTEDIETTRVDPAFDLRQKWVLKCDINWRVQRGPLRLVRAVLRADDLDETVMAIITNALRSAVYINEVGTMETDEEVKAAVLVRAKVKLAGLGVSIHAVNIIKYAPVDAQILANAIAGARKTSDDESTTLPEIGEILVASRAI